MRLAASKNNQDLLIEGAAANMSDLSFSVLHLLNSERNAFGLRNKEYERYKKHSASKVHNLRKSTGLTHGASKGGYKKPVAVSVDQVNDVRVLQLYLFEAERCLTAANELQSLALQQSELSGRYKREQISRLRKASSWSQKLVNLAQALSDQSGAASAETPAAYIDQKTFAEVHSYHLHILSTLAFAHAQYSTALPLFLTRRKILQTLSDQAQTSHEQALADLEIDNLGSVVRFSAYKLGRDRRSASASVDESQEIADEFKDEELEEVYPGLVKLLTGLTEHGKKSQDANVKGQSARTLNKIIWEDKEMKIKSPEVVRAMIKVQGFILDLQRSFSRRSKAEGEVSEGIPTDTGFQWNSVPAGRNDVRGGGIMKKYDRLLAGLIEAESISRRQSNMDTTEAAGSSSQTGSADFVHQWIVYLLLSWRIRRDMILIRGLWQPTVEEVVDTVTAATAAGKNKRAKNKKPIANLHAVGQGGKALSSLGTKERGLPRIKREQACRNLQAVIKVWDTILQSVGQMQELGMIIERDQLESGIRALSSWGSSIRLLKLAQLHVLLPEPSYPTAVHIVTRSQEYIAETKQCIQGLQDDQDLFYHLRAKDVSRTESQVSALDRGIKRAWFAVTNKKPIFFDLAFNYVDLPMEELERAAGREPSQPVPEPQGVIGSAISKLPDSVRGSVESIENVVEKKLAPAAARLIPGTGVSRGRESTPAPEAEDEEEEEEVPERQPETPSKSGWFGGLFGGKK